MMIISDLSARSQSDRHLAHVQWTAADDDAGSWSTPRPSMSWGGQKGNGVKKSRWKKGVWLPPQNDYPCLAGHLPHFNRIEGLNNSQKFRSFALSSLSFDSAGLHECVFFELVVVLIRSRFGSDSIAKGRYARKGGWPQQYATAPKAMCVCVWIEMIICNKFVAHSVMPIFCRLKRQNAAISSVHGYHGSAW